MNVETDIIASSIRRAVIKLIMYFKISKLMLLFLFG